MDWWLSRVLCRHAPNQLLILYNTSDSRWHALALDSTQDQWLERLAMLGFKWSDQMARGRDLDPEPRCEVLDIPSIEQLVLDKVLEATRVRDPYSYQTNVISQ